MSFVKWLSGSTVVEALQIARLSYRGSAQRRKLLSLRSKFRIVQSHNLPLRKTYFFTSEKGIYLLERNTIIQVTDLPTYGLAIAGDVCYLGAYLQDKNTTILRRGRCEALFHDDTSFEFEIIYKSVVDSSNHRIHQVTTGQSSIWCALTGNNTLLEVDVSSGQILNEYAVFLDQYGWPVTGTDHNHVNSVHAYGNYLLYTLYRVGNQSLVALCHDGEVIGYAYPNTGVHDIYLYTDGFIISDTFGDKTREGGFPVTVDSLFDESFFNQLPGYVVRGLAGHSDLSELLIGHSHKGPRSERFDGNGAILYAHNGCVKNKIEVEPSQIYQIVATDGVSLQPSTTPSVDDLTAMLEDSFGPPIYRQPFLSIRAF